MTTTSKKPETVIVRFAGDSGDGMQLVGDRFTAATAHVGNDLSTLPDFPAEIRAPAGTPGGVSAFQIHFASRDILTPGDHPNTLVAMNPAALKAHLAALEKGGTLIVNEDAFTAANLRKAGYEANPLEDGTIEDYQTFEVPMTTLTTRATDDIEGLKPAEAQRTKNLFALGLISWMYGRPGKETISWLEAKFASKPAIMAGQRRRLQGRLQLRRHGGDRGDPDRSRAGAAGAGRVPQHQRRQRAGDGADRGQRPQRAAALLRDAIRSPPPPNCSTTSPATTASASAPSRPRTRSPPPTWRSAPPSAAASG